MNDRAVLHFREFTDMIEAFGFELLRINGSRRIVAWRNVREIANVQSTKDGKAEEYQVRRFLGLVERNGSTIEE